MSALGRLDTERQFGDIILKTGAPSGDADSQGGALQPGGLRPRRRPGRAGRPELRPDRHRGRPAVRGLAVFLLPGANALDVADAVKQQMEELKSRFPAGPRIRHRLRHHAVHPAIGRGGVQHAA